MTIDMKRTSRDGRHAPTPPVFILMMLMLTQTLWLGTLVGCSPAGPSAAEQARFRDQYLLAEPPSGAITLAELSTRLNPVPRSAVAVEPNSDTETPTSETETPTTETETPTAETETPTSEPETPTTVVLKARLAPAAPDLEAQIKSYPWDDGGRAFYVAELGGHEHDGHDADCPFCAARKAGSGGMSQLVKVTLVTPSGEPPVSDLRPLLKLTGNETLHLVGKPTLLPSGLMELAVTRLHIERPSAS